MLDQPAILGAAALADTGGVTLVDVPGTVPAGNYTSIGAMVPSGAKCRVVIKDGVAQKWRGPRALARTSYMEFGWTQESGAAAGTWGARVLCRTSVGKVTSKWAEFQITSRVPDPMSVPTFGRPSSANLSSVPMASGWRPFGTVLIKGSDWYGGHGVDVMSNGGNGCANGCSLRWTYGAKYQCVELVERFIRTQGWVDANIMGNARDIYGNAPKSAFDKHPAGDGYIPVPGDIITWTGGSAGYGHVAVVSDVTKDGVTFMEQNASRTGTFTLKYSSNGALAGYGALSHQGYLHAKANPRG